MRREVLTIDYSSQRRASSAAYSFLQHKIGEIPTLPGGPFRNKIRCQPQSGTQLNLVRAIYPGSFDPLTNGHLDLIERGSKIFDELIVSILRNTEKDPLFNLAERLEMSKHLTRRFENVHVEAFD